VGWLAYPMGQKIFEKDLIVKTGAVELPAFRNSDSGKPPCFTIQEYQNDMIENTGKTFVLATINHHHR
jgi:hypothetical protein